MEVVALLSQGRTAAAQCGLFTHKSVPVIFEPPCTSWFISLILFLLPKPPSSNFSLYLRLSNNNLEELCISHISFVIQSPFLIIYLKMMYNIRWRVNSRKLIILQLFPVINPSVTEAGIPISLR